MYMCLHVKYQLFFSDFNERYVSSIIFEKYLNFTLHEHPPVEAEFSSADGRRDRQRQRQTDMTELIVGFRIFFKRRDRHDGVNSRF
jgi:hypothetical protein